MDSLLSNIFYCVVNTLSSPRVLASLAAGFAVHCIGVTWLCVLGLLLPISAGLPSAGRDCHPHPAVAIAALLHLPPAQACCLPLCCVSSRL
eukprot:COSAG02_NODE_44507_length_365_cov_1.357143_1_plen_90_part_10